MTDTPEPAVTPAPAPARRRRRLRVLAACLGALVLLVAGGYTFLDSQMALDYVLRRVIAASEGRLTIEGGTGSLLSTVKADRIAWRGDDIDAEATNVAMTWSPTDLLSRRFNVQGLGASRIRLTFRRSTSTASGLPPNLALPLEVAIRHAGVERIEWRTEDGGGAVTGVAFGYLGGAREHEVRELRFVTADGTLSGDATLGTQAPFPLAGSLAFVGDGRFRDGRATLTLAGALERIDVAAAATLRDAAVDAKALVTPFAASPVVSADIRARNVDAARFDPAWPATDLTVSLVARPVGGGFAGTVDARNATPGPIDRARVPLAALSAQYAWDGTTLALNELVADLGAGGQATGSGRLSFDGRPSQWDLRVRDVNLAAVQTSLLATRVSGTVVAEVAQQRQVVRADLRQANMALSFAATVDGTRVDVTQLRAQAGEGSLVGSGEIVLEGARPFSINAKAARFDPARFVDVPAGVLNGTVSARGTLAPTYDVTAAVTLDQGSRYADQPVAGSAKARVKPGAARDIAVDVKVGSATIVLAGAFGTAADRLSYDLDLPRLSDLRAPLARFARYTMPERAAGSVRARGTVTGDLRSPGFTVDATGKDLHWEAWLAAEAVTVKASLAPGTTAQGREPLDRRALQLALDARGLATLPSHVRTLRIDVDGTLARHAAKLSAAGDDLDITATIAGGLHDIRRADGTPDLGWAGTLDSLRNRGTHPVLLEAPALLEVARERVHVGDARLQVADGRVELALLTLEQGRLTTRGSFAGIPVTAIARFAGTTMPLASTLVLGGDWSLAATPRLNGTLNVRRESGDLYATESATLKPADLALGITVLELGAKWADDAVVANAQFRSARAGTADATISLAAGPSPGRISTDAAFTAKLTADLASLRPLQPWLGTFAVLDGRAHIDADARGTLARPLFAGTLTGDALRFDLPQYGVHLRDGRLRARLAGESLMLDEFSFAGGQGRFNARGTLARAQNARDRANATANVTWDATDFTVVNRPDLQLVADGKGTLALVDGKLALAGAVNIDQGRVTYEPVTDGALGDDVVIVGQPRQAVVDTTANLPLVLDLEVALGRDFRFSGEGLETRLGGRVRVTTTSAGALHATGTIRAISGTYFVFGQRLDIDRGRLLFDGPVNNPGLDVVALRRNLAVEAGVELTGTVRVPRVRLVSNPPVPDGEKLSWLLTGQGLDRASRADFALLSAASATLLGRGQKPITQQIANQVGLDDISVRETGTVGGSLSGSGGQVVAFGKRISDRLSLIYEQGLTVATNALRIEYTLSRFLTLRAEAGTVSSLGLYFRRTYD